MGEGRDPIAGSLRSGAGGLHHPHGGIPAPQPAPATDVYPRLCQPPSPPHLAALPSCPHSQPHVPGRTHLRLRLTASIYPRVPTRTGNRLLGWEF